MRGKLRDIISSARHLLKFTGAAAVLVNIGCAHETKIAEISLSRVGLIKGSSAIVALTTSQALYISNFDKARDVVPSRCSIFRSFEIGPNPSDASIVEEHVIEMLPGHYIVHYSQHLDSSQLPIESVSRWAVFDLQKGDHVYLGRFLWRGDTPARQKVDESWSRILKTAGFKEIKSFSSHSEAGTAYPNCGFYF